MFPVWHHREGIFKLRLTCSMFAFPDIMQCLAGDAACEMSVKLERDIVLAVSCK